MSPPPPWCDITSAVLWCCIGCVTPRAAPLDPSLPNVHNSWRLVLFAQVTWLIRLPCEAIVIGKVRAAEYGRLRDRVVLRGECW